MLSSMWRQPPPQTPPILQEPKSSVFPSLWWKKRPEDLDNLMNQFEKQQTVKGELNIFTKIITTLAENQSFNFQQSIDEYLTSNFPRPPLLFGHTTGIELLITAANIVIAANNKNPEAANETTNRAIWILEWVKRNFVINNCTSSAINTFSILESMNIEKTTLPKTQQQIATLFRCLHRLREYNEMDGPHLGSTTSSGSKSPEPKSQGSDKPTEQNKTVNNSSNSIPATTSRHPSSLWRAGGSSTMAPKLLPLPPNDRASPTLPKWPQNGDEPPPGEETMADIPFDEIDSGDENDSGAAKLQRQYR